MNTYNDYWQNNYLQHYGKIGMKWGKRNAVTPQQINALRDRINQDSKNRREINADIIRRKPSVAIKRDRYNAYLQAQFARSLGGRSPGELRKHKIRKYGRRMRRRNMELMRMDKTLNKNNNKLIYNHDFLKTLNS